MKLIITVGAPASGKTTWAQEQARKDGNTRIVSRDDVRTTLYGSLRAYKFTEEKEEFVSRVEDTIVDMALSSGKNVIVHDTNLKQGSIDHWKEIGKKYNATFEIEYFDCHITELLKRNFYRGDKAIPVSRIWAMHRAYRIMRGWKPVVFDTKLPQAVIFDVDGTLTHVGQRSPFDFTKVKDDPPNEQIQNLFNMYKQTHICLVASGRTNAGDCLRDTIANLESTGVYPDDVYMRADEDTRHDFDVKEDILREIAKKYNVVLAVDDRDTPVGMWRMHGITTVQVGYGDF